MIFKLIKKGVIHRVTVFNLSKTMPTSLSIADNGTRRVRANTEKGKDREEREKDGRWPKK